MQKRAWKHKACRCRQKLKILREREGQRILLDHLQWPESWGVTNIPGGETRHCSCTPAPQGQITAIWTRFWARKFGSYECVQLPEGKLWRRWSQVPFSGAQWQGPRQWAQTEIQDVLSEHQETLSVLWRGLSTGTGCPKSYGISILRDAQNPTGPGTGQLF